MHIYILLGLIIYLLKQFTVIFLFTLYFHLLSSAYGVSCWKRHKHTYHAILTNV